MFCGQCGEENPDVNRFCFECGARLFSPRTDPGGPLVDAVDARLQGLGALPEPSLDWPDDLPRSVTGADGATLLLVPAGFSWMGARRQKKDERPYRLIYLDSYYVDETPVTCGQYAKFLAATGTKAPPGFKSRSALPKWAQLPVTCVTWYEAAAYAKWAQRRLLTEAEWEKAARGIDGRTYPWGEASPDGHEPQLACFGEDRSLPVAVGLFPEGRSPLGALDMAGNVWEWCADQYDQAYYPRSPPRNPRCDDGDPRYRVLRGGACSYSAFTLRTTFRGFNLPHQRAVCYGFRCAADVARYRRRPA